MGRLKAKLSEGQRGHCPRCGHDEFNIEDGLFLLPLSRRIDENTTPTRALPSIVTSCNECGFISMHALGSLGLMKERSLYINGGDDQHR